MPRRHSTHLKSRAPRSGWICIERRCILAGSQQSLLNSPWFYIILAAVASVVVIVLVLRKRWRIKEIEIGLPTKLKFGPEPEQAYHFQTPKSTPTAEPEQQPTEVYGNLQLGSPIIRVLRGVRVFRNWQIGKPSIEVTDGTTGATSNHQHEAADPRRP